METLIKWRHRLGRIWLIFATAWILGFGSLLLLALAAGGALTNQQLTSVLRLIFETPASLGLTGWLTFAVLELHLRRAAER